MQAFTKDVSRGKIENLLCMYVCVFFLSSNAHQFSDSDSVHTLESEKLGVKHLFVVVVTQVCENQLTLEQNPEFICGTTFLFTYFDDFVFRCSVFFFIIFENALNHTTKFCNLLFFSGISHITSVLLLLCCSSPQESNQMTFPLHFQVCFLFQAMVGRILLKKG